MRIPKKLIICGHEYKVIVKEQLVEGKDNCWGVCDAENNIIYLQKGMNKSQLQEIILHESIHAIQAINNERTSEKSVKTLALALLALIKTNRLNFLD